MKLARNAASPLVAMAAAIAAKAAFRVSFMGSFSVF